MPVLEGKRMTIMLAPKKTAPAPKKGAKEEAADASDED